MIVLDDLSSSDTDDLEAWCGAPEPGACVELTIEVRENGKSGVDLIYSEIRSTDWDRKRSPIAVGGRIETLPLFDYSDVLALIEGELRRADRTDGTHEGWAATMANLRHLGRWEFSAERSG